MRWLIERVILALTASLLVLTLASSEPSALAFAGLVALAVTAIVTVRYAAILLRARELGIGRRAREHRQVLAFEPAPQHPNTAGRPRSRAPSRPIAAALPAH